MTKVFFAQSFYFLKCSYSNTVHSNAPQQGSRTCYANMSVSIEGKRLIVARIAVVTDSSSSLPPTLAEKHGIHVMPVYVIFGKQTFQDGVDLTAEQFYRLLRESKELPTTAQPSVMDFVQAYTRLARQVDAIVSIHLSHEMSATLDSALAAAKELPQVPIHVIDSGSVSMGLGFIALAAARAAAEGKSVAEVVRAAEDLIPKMNVVFTVDTLEYLHKGGRIGGAGRGPGKGAHQDASQGVPAEHYGRMGRISASGARGRGPRRPRPRRLRS